MKHFNFITLTIALSLGGVSCSNQYRDLAGSDMEFVLSSLEQVAPEASTSSNAEINQFRKLMAVPGASLYYADSLPDGAYGPVVSVSSLSSYAFFGNADLWHGNIEEVRIFFVNVPYDTGDQSALLMAIKESGKDSYEVKAFVSTQNSFIEGGEFVAVLGTGDVNKLVLRTKYLDDSDDLEEVIRMDVSEFDANGDEVYIGQFSTLQGFEVTE